MHRLTKLKWMAKIFAGYLKDRRRQRKPLNKSGKKIIFTLDDNSLFRADDGLGREAYHVLKSFSEAGYNVYFWRPMDFKSYWGLGFLGRLIASIPNVRFTTKLPENPGEFIYAFDTIRTHWLKLPWRKLVYVNIKKPADCHLGNVVAIPFYMMPLILAEGLDKQLRTYRRQKRLCRVFFGGSMNPQYYDSPVFKRKYPHLMTRLQGIRAVTESKIDCWMINTAPELRKFLNHKEYLRRLVMLEVKGIFPIKPKDWLGIVARSDFFMCFSGTDYPMCHNAIEAMAVGSIPILAYDDWFYPRLEHGKNAIVYSNRQDMLNKLEMAMRMPQEQIEYLRENVMDYYDRNLYSGRLADIYESNAQRLTTLMLFPRMVSDDGSYTRDFIQGFEKMDVQEKDESFSHYTNL